MIRTLRLALAAAILLVPAADLRAAPVATPAWYSGFEDGFPGEFLDYDNMTYTDADVPNPGKNEAWSIVGADKFPDILAGEHVYKGWVTAAQASSHRAYPVLHTDIVTPAVNTFWVWLDVDWDMLAVPDWVHFGTWGKQGNNEWIVHTLSVRDRKLEVAHLQNVDYIGPEPQPEFPLKQWVRFTVYVHYPEDGGDGVVCTWQDGVPMIAGTWNEADGTHLTRVHWGEYAAGAVNNGVQYNDEIQLWTLDEPLPGCDGPEPESPYAPLPMDTTGDDSSSSGDDTSTGSDASTGDPDPTAPETTSGPGPDPTTAPETTTTSSDTGGDTGQGNPTNPDPTTAPDPTTGTAATATTGPPATDDPAGDSGCGCTTAPPATTALLGLLALAAVPRRRRRTIIA
jgi:MYXO-CTERM domain-containing protein